ncbi:hypothetical protein ACKKBG_A21165 [Auxenochlorella protothecoides x Auxenochlorella symbiontica]
MVYYSTACRAPASAAAPDTRSAPCATARTRGAEDETFELVDEDGRVVGTAPRGDCHARGLLHKSVFCWVMDPEGNILLQQRSLAKKLGRGQWDLSVAEHLQPGEEYAEAAVRGLQEELGISVSRADLRPLAPAHLRDLKLPNFHDRELVQNYLLPGWRGDQLTVDPVEVEGTRWISREDLIRDTQANPEAYNPWLRSEGSSLSWLQGACGQLPTMTDQRQCVPY